MVGSSCVVRACECCFNTQAGITITGTPAAEKTARQSVEISLVENTVQENKQNGLEVIDLRVGTVSLEKCIVASNHGYGVYLSSSELLPSLQTLDSASPQGTAPAKARSSVDLINGVIKNNIGGLYIRDQPTRVDGTEIQMNGPYAVFLFSADSKNSWTCTQKTMEGKTIQGAIGGHWGRTGIHPSGQACGCSICTIV